MNNKGMFYTNVDDYETKEDMMNDFIALRMYDMAKDKEIERLNKGYCPIKEKCNKGECDCTNEEYTQMCEENTKLDLEIERLNKKSEILEENNKLLIQQKSQLYKDLDIAYERIDKAIEYLNNDCMYDEHLGYCDDLYCGQVQELVNILEGDKDGKN